MDRSVTFVTFIQDLIWQNVQIADNSFNDYNDFLNHINSVYCTLDGFINYCKSKDISQSAEKEKIKKTFENLPEIEKRKLNFAVLTSLKNRDLELFLINLSLIYQINGKIKYKDYEFKSYF